MGIDTLTICMCVHVICHIIAWQSGKKSRSDADEREEQVRESACACAAASALRKASSNGILVRQGARSDGKPPPMADVVHL